MKRATAEQRIPPSMDSPVKVEPSDDGALIRAALAGQTDAFGRLITRYQDRLYTTMLHVTGSVDDARDAVQDAFVQAFVKLASFQQDARFFTWLYRIAFNQWVSRTRRKRPALSTDGLKETVGVEPADRGGLPGDRLERDESIRQVQQAMALLSEDYRTVLLLREMEGFCYEEIAEILAVPVGTVRSRLARARMQLRKHLMALLGPDFP